MKSLTIFVTTAWISSAVAQSFVRAPSSPSNPYEQYPAVRIWEQNRAKELPSPVYWGVAGMEWETPPGLMGNGSSGETSTMLGRACRRSLKFESPSGGLSAVQFQFASGVTSREERLAQYQALKAELMRAYQAPTHNIRPDEIFRGKDKYVQGLAGEYCLEWRGRETMISLRLSDLELTLQFRQAPSSRALAMRQEAAKGRDLLNKAKGSGNAMPLTPSGSTPLK